MSERMQMLIKTIKSSTLDGMRGYLRNEILDLDHGYFAPSARALVRRGLLIRVAMPDGMILWGLTPEGWRK